MSNALMTIAVGVVVERSKAATQWDDFLWRPVAVLPGEPDTPAWTKLSGDEQRLSFYAGTATIELYRTETTQYRDNLASGTPSLWVVLRHRAGDPPHEVHLVTANPTEGEASTESGSDIVDAVPMPRSIAATIAAFVAEHHVERTFIKRQRDKPDPGALGRRPPVRQRDS